MMKDGEEQQKDRSANKEWQNCNKQQQAHQNGIWETPWGVLGWIKKIRGKRGHQGMH
jgi:hypothetical protein